MFQNCNFDPPGHLTSVRARGLVGLGISFHPESELVVIFSARAAARAAEAPAEARALSGESMNAEEIEHKAEQKPCTCMHAHAWMPTGAKESGKNKTEWGEKETKTTTTTTLIQPPDTELINHFSK